MKDLIGKAKKLTNGKGVGYDAAHESFRLLAKAYLDYKNVAQNEETKRKAIGAWRDQQLAQIERERHILELYLVEIFKERSQTIGAFFKKLDIAIEGGDDKLIEQSIGAILTIVKESPLAQAKELMQAMHNADVQIIDI